MIEEVLERLRRCEIPELTLPDVVEALRPSSVALLSSSWDPPTVAHVALAEAARRAAELVVLVYSVRTLSKDPAAEPPLLSERERLDIVRVLCAGRPGWVFGLCSHGLLADHVVAADRRFHEASIRLVVGSDKALQLLDPAWYADRDATLDALFARVDVLYAERRGQEGAVASQLSRPEHARWAGAFQRLGVSAEVSGVSSRQVRARARAGQAVETLVPPEALEVILAAGRRGTAEHPAS